MEIILGSAKSIPGKITYGELDLVEHPIGGKDTVPVILAQGLKKGPVFWITAGIHGIEHAGLQVIHKLITPELVNELNGTIVAIPGLNPAGLRTGNRQAYYHNGDPNRLFPDGKEKKVDEDKAPPSALEQAYSRIYEEITKTADFYFDLHCISIASMSFVFRDRLLYPKGNTAAEEKAKITSQKMDEMAMAFGHTVIADFATSKYIDEKLHRATTASVAMLAGIPALTAELSSSYTPNRKTVDAAVSGLRNVMRWAGMLLTSVEPINGVKVISLGYPVRRRSVARVTKACIVHHLVEAGDFVKIGDPLVEMRDAWGREIGLLRSDHDGFVISCPPGVVCYPGDSTVLLAIKDDEPVIGEYPEGYFP